MDLYTIIAIGFGLAMDAFAVSLAYGLSFEDRQHVDAFKVSCAFGFFQAGMPVLGWLGGRALKAWIAPIAPWLALVVLGFLGGKMIIGAWKDEEHFRISTDLKVLAVLAVATSIDALAVGLLIALLGVSLGLPIAIFGTVTFAVSYAGIVGGFELKNLLRNAGRRIVQAAGGVILVGIGVRILVGHLLQH
ncbi:MAG: manganese efflux pump MntP family protein [Holophaga sp.]